MATTVKKLEVLFAAANLLGPEADKDNVDSEYERGVVEMVRELLGGSDDRESVAILLRSLL